MYTYYKQRQKLNNEFGYTANDKLMYKIVIELLNN